MTKRKSKNNDQRSNDLAKVKLESSGLTLDDAKELHIKIIPDASKLNTSFKPVRAIQFNYRTPDNKPMLDMPKSDPFYRVRYLEQPTDFASLTDKKEVRYVQEPNTAPCAYYPSNITTWVEIASNKDEPIIITEGELKSAKACKEGFPTIGLGGVHSWQSRKLGITWLPSLDLINWPKRNVYICFDSDYQTNPQVCIALKDLADELQKQGAFVHLVTLPNLPELSKVGLDDFLTLAGKSANAQFRHLLERAEPLGLTGPLWDFNKQYVYIKNPGLIINQDTRFKVAPGAFKDHLESKASYQECLMTKDGSVKYRPVSAAGAWLKWPLRLDVGTLTYKPGESKFTTNSGPAFNIWPGWGCEPKKGPVKLFLQLIDWLFTGAEESAKRWFLQWCAHPFQHPGTKLFTSSVLYGIKQGTGKSLVGYTLGRIYGKNFTEINNVDLNSNFNEWAEAKQFVLGDDVTGVNGKLARPIADILKKLITQQELRVNPKYIASYVVPDCINYLFTSNHPDAFFLEDDDRRFFIHEVTVEPLPDEFYRDYFAWLKGPGAAAIFQYLLKLDLTGFNPAASAIKTSAKERMISDVRSDLAAWVRQLMATPDAVTTSGHLIIDKDLFTSKELLNFYDPSGKTGTTAQGLGKELRRAGVKQIFGGQPIRTQGGQGRYFIVRNDDSWVGCQPSKAVKHLDDWSAKQSMEPKY